MHNIKTHKANTFLKAENGEQTGFNKTKIKLTKYCLKYDSQIYIQFEHIHCRGTSKRIPV